MTPGGAPPHVVLAAGTVGGAGTSVSLGAAVRGLCAATPRPRLDVVVNPAAARVLEPHRREPHSADAGVEVVVRSRVAALLDEVVGRPRADVWIGFADRLPLLRRAAPVQVMVVQNPHLYRRDTRWSLRRRAKFLVLGAWARRSARRADLVVCSTASGRAAFLAACRVDPTAVQVRPIPVEEPPVVKTEHRARIGRVLLVGDTYGYKRLAEAVDAVAVHAGRTGHPVEVVHLGRTVDAGASADLDAAGTRAADSGVTLVRRGGVAHAEVLAEMAAADVLLLGSDTETQGLPLAEAMAVGVPVLCRELDVFVDQAGGAAETVSLSAGPDEVADALGRLEDPGRRRELARSARARVVTGAGWDLMADGPG